MSRFGTYLLSQKLAKAHLLTAEEKMRRKDPIESVLNHLIHAVREFQTSTNCLASLMFEPRRKKQ